jgi:hypothetical protein
MFIGHFALALGAKKTTPSVSLGTTFLACQFADLLWPTLVVLGIESVEVDPGNTLVTPLNFVSYPYSHSLVMLMVWAGLFALVYRFIRGWNQAAIITVVALVLSHYLLDVITHRPDLPITIHGSRRLGLGLWNHPGTTLAVELTLFIIGGALYTSVTVARDAIGRIGFWALYVVLVAIYFAALYGPPPPNTAAVAIAGHLSWLFVIWAYWVDHHRRAR